MSNNTLLKSIRALLLVTSFTALSLTGCSKKTAAPGDAAKTTEKITETQTQSDPAGNVVNKTEKPDPRARPAVAPATDATTDNTADNSVHPPLNPNWVNEHGNGILYDESQFRAFEGREGSVQAGRNLGKLMRDYIGKGTAPASSGKTPGAAFRNRLGERGRTLVAQAAEEAAVLKALQANGDLQSSDYKNARQTLANNTAQTLVDSGLAAGRATGIAALVHLEIELFLTDETDWALATSTVVPLKESSDKKHTYFTQVSYRKDKEKFVSREKEASQITEQVASVGLVYRHLPDHKKHLWGVNAFVDSDTDEHWRASVGYDINWGAFGLSTNAYRALSGWRSTDPGFQARVRNGFDIHGRGKVQALNGTELGVRLFKWLGYDEGEDIDGAELTAAYSPFPLLNINTSYGFNDGDLPQWQVGASLTFELDKTLAEQMRPKSFAEKTDLETNRYDKVRREGRLLLQERIKPASKVRIVSITGNITVANAKGTKTLNNPGDVFAFPATFTVSSGAGDNVALVFDDNATLSASSGSAVSVQAAKVTLTSGGFVRYDSGAISRSLGIAGDIEIELLGTTVELRSKNGEKTFGILHGRVRGNGPGWTATGDRFDIIDALTGIRLTTRATRLAHITDSNSSIDTPQTHSSVWNGDDPDGNGLDFEAEQLFGENGILDLERVKVRLSGQGTGISNDGGGNFRTSESAQARFTGTASLFLSNIPISLTRDVAVKLDYSGSAANSDVSGRVNSVTISAGSTSVSFDYTVVDDSSSEADEAFVVAVAEVTGGPTEDGDQKLTLTVLDNENTSLAPVANAGADIIAPEKSIVHFSGSATAATNRTIVSQTWTQTSGPTVTLSDSSALSPSFTAPEVASTTTLTFQLSATDSTGLANADSITVTVTPDGSFAPQANAGSDQNTTERSTVTLDASASSATSGRTLTTFAWTQTAGTSVTLSATTIAQPNFTAPDVAANAALTFQVTVTDSVGVSNSDIVTITVTPNAALTPTANAGADQNAAERSTVNLIGSSSATSGRTIVSQAWTQTTGSSVTLSGASTNTPSFTAPDVASNTSLTFSFTVTDSVGVTASDSVTVTVQPNASLAPSVDAGSDQTVNEKDTVDLEAQISAASGRTIVSQTWTQTSGPTVTIDDADEEDASFDAPEVGSPTALTFQVSATDSVGVSSSDQVTVQVNPDPALAPAADAGSDETKTEKDAVTLDGTSSSTASGRTIVSYAWTQTAGSPTVTLTNAGTDTASFTAPEVSSATSLTFQLTVTDSLGVTDTDSVTITVNPNPALAPTANAGSDQTVFEVTTVTLNGAASTASNGRTLSFAWTQTGGTSVTLNNANTSAPSFTAPDVASDTTLTFSLTVTDNIGASTSDTVSVTVQRNTAHAPVAKAGNDKNATEKTSVALDGTASNAANGRTLVSAAWTQTGGSPTVTLTNANTQQATFTAPEVGSDTTLTFTLTVTDNIGVGDTDEIEVTIKPDPNLAPTANAGSDQAVSEASAVNLSGASSTAASGRTLSFAWTQTSGTSVTLNNANTSAPSFTAPAVASNTNLTFKLTATDNVGVSAEDTVVITVEPDANLAPTASAGSDQSKAEGATVTLNSSGSTAGSGRSIVSRSWSQISGTPSLILSDSTATSPTFTAPSVTSDKTFTFRVTVTDNIGVTDIDDVVITVMEVPTADAGNNQNNKTERSTVTLDSTGSSAQGGRSIVSRSWSQTSGTAVTLSSSTATQPTFTAPDVAINTNLVFELTVTDSAGLTDTDSVTITVKPDSALAPTANAGSDQTKSTQTTVNLSGASSTAASGRTLSFSWTQTGGTTVTINNASTSTPSFTSPNSAGTLTFRLTVTDNVGVSDDDTVTVTIIAKPTANAGNDQTVTELTTVNLSGASSTAASGATLTGFSWTQTGGSSVTLTGASTNTPSFTAPDVSSNTNLTFELTVTDNAGGTATDTITVTVQPGATVPVAAISASGSGSSRTLSGAASTASSGATISTYAWSVQAGSPSTCKYRVGNSNVTTASGVSVEARKDSGSPTCVYVLTVTDNVAKTDSETVTVNY